MLLILGPAGGAKGGEILAEGTPEALQQNKNSITGQYLLEERNIRIKRKKSKESKKK